MDKIEIVIVTGMSGAGKQLQWLLLKYGLLLY
mgnify:CR=1 FL=1